MGETILTGFIGAVIALYLNFYYDLYKESKRVNEYRKTMIKVIESRLLPKYSNISNDYNKHYQTITNHIPGDKLHLNMGAYSLNENDLRDIFPLEDIIKVFNTNKTANYNSILKIEDFISILNRFSPEFLATEYVKELEELYNNSSPDIDVENVKEYYKNSFYVQNIYALEIIKIYNIILKDLKQNSIE